MNYWKQMKREDVYELIDGERAYQDALGSERVVQSRMARSVCEELVLLQVLVQRAFEVWVDTPADEEALVMMRKIAAVAVRCMEQHGTSPR